MFLQTETPSKFLDPPLSNLYAHKNLLLIVEMLSIKQKHLYQRVLESYNWSAKAGISDLLVC